MWAAAMRRAGPASGETTKSAFPNLETLFDRCGPLAAILFSLSRLGGSDTKRASLSCDDSALALALRGTAARAPRTSRPPRPVAMLSLAMRPHAVMGDGTLARRTVFIKNSQRVDRDTLARTMRAPAASRRGCRGVRAAAPSSPPRPCADAPDDSVHRARSAALAASAMLVRPPSSARPRRAPGAKRPRAGVTPLRAFSRGNLRSDARGASLGASAHPASPPSRPVLSLHPPPRRPPDPSSPPPPDPRNVFAQAAAAPAASAWAAANNDLAQTAAFGGPDAWIRGALAVTALSSSYAVFSSAVSKSPSAKSPAAASASSATAETEEAVAADAEARRLRVALERAEAESAALRRENASLAARVDEVTAKLTRDTAHLEKSLRREQTAKEELSADAARFKAAAEASAEKGERTAELAADLESKIEALRVAAEEEKAGFGRELVDEATRAAQLADQLQATQRTANKLAAEVEGYRRDADAFNAKRLLDHTRLRAAEGKIAAVERKRDEEKAAAAERERTLERAAKDAQRDARSARAEAKALAERLEETERRLELERAGSLAEAKRRAMAMLGRDPSPTPTPTTPKRRRTSPPRWTTMTTKSPSEECLRRTPRAATSSSSSSTASRSPSRNRRWTRGGERADPPRIWTSASDRARPRGPRRGAASTTPSPNSSPAKSPPRRPSSPRRDNRENGCRRTTPSARSTTGTITSRWRRRGSCRRGRA